MDSLSNHIEIPDSEEDEPVHPIKNPPFHHSPEIPDKEPEHVSNPPVVDSDHEHDEEHDQDHDQAHNTTPPVVKTPDTDQDHDQEHNTLPPVVKTPDTDQDVLKVHDLLNHDVHEILSDFNDSSSEFISHHGTTEGGHSLSENFNHDIDTSGAHLVH
jgi:hypothetical protein